ncbi:hypothetical protein [Pedobacter gandavensis]|uniref:Secreted protein n=1 Tax=Pedobacter gandavensis TaxID=2679963 RepID=A0ABR6EZ96_9SPHI|nr:hypothetical protein [Pedobacter gandavensis]MBB2150491.1 hypothetical protein [Pedobacter gandavensis]
MLKRFTAVLLLITLLLAQFSRVFVYAGFELNERYIATVLCENKDKPAMHCNGKCYLAKKLKQAEEKEKKQERDAQKKNAQDVFFVRSAALPILPLIVQQTEFPMEASFELPVHNNEIPHPPPSSIFIFS